MNNEDYLAQKELHLAKLSKGISFGEMFKELDFYRTLTADQQADYEATIRAITGNLEPEPPRTYLTVNGWHVVSFSFSDKRCFMKILTRNFRLLGKKVGYGWDETKHKLTKPQANQAWRELSADGVAHVAGYTIEWSN